MKRVAYHLIFGLFLSVLTVVLLETVAALFTPSWPYRDLRSVGPEFLQRERTIMSYHPHWWSPVNSWGMRDLERAVQAPNGGKRLLFIGDSFLEGGFTDYPLSLLVEKDLFMGGMTSWETINLGVSATDPKSYFFRFKQVGLKLAPDLVFIFFYSGNDFLRSEEGFEGSRFFSVIDELPKPSLLGSIAPRLTWLLVNRFRVSELLRGNPSVPGEFEALFTAAQLPYEEGLQRITQHVHRFYFPNLDEKVISSILGRGGLSFWSSLKFKEADPEFLQGWILKNLLLWEIQSGKYAASTAEADTMLAPNEIASTLTWLRAANDLAATNGIKVVLFLVPVGTADPSFVAYWKPWPRYFSWNYISDARHLRLSHRLKEEGFSFVDLRDVLDGIPDTYRKTDGHWTAKGQSIVAARVRQEIGKLYPELRANHH